MRHIKYLFVVIIFCIFNKIHSQQVERACNCHNELVKSITAFHTDLKFSNNGVTFNKDSLAKWGNNPMRLNVRSITLIDFDTIPIEFGMFDNVERIDIESINNFDLTGLQLFKKLRILVIEGGRIKLDSNSLWLKSIETIIANKTLFIGIKSFRHLPSLKEMRLTYSGFDTFPDNFESLECLAYFSTGAHTFGVVDLSGIDLSGMDCLHYVEFHSWRDNIIGIPKGITKKKIIKIHYAKMKKTDKLKLKHAKG